MNDKHAAGRFGNDISGNWLAINDRHFADALARIDDDKVIRCPVSQMNFQAA